MFHQHAVEAREAAPREDARDLRVGLLACQAQAFAAARKLG